MPICLAVLAVITLLNLRGLGAAARAFLLPTMVFIVGLLAILAIGLLHPLAPHVAPLSRSLLPARAVEPVGLLLLLKAFSAGCSALTGVEAIANGVPLCKPPRVRRAKRTELLLGVILGAMLLGVATLAGRWRVAPRSGQTVLSQVMTIAVGRDWADYAMSLTVVTAVATVVFLATKFTEGAWVVVLALPAFIMLFTRIHRYYDQAGRALGIGRIPGKPQARPTAVVVPVTGVSRLAQYGISVALSISEHVEAVTVVRSGAGEESERVRELQRQWTRWNPGVPLRVLRTEYASVARPIVAFVDRLRRHCNEPVIVLIPVALPDRLRYRFLHNHIDWSSPGRCGTGQTSSSPACPCGCTSAAASGRYQPGGCARP